MQTRFRSQAYFVFLCTVLLCPPLSAIEDKPDKPQTEVKEADSIPQSDIWQEVTFEPGREFGLSEEKIQAILEEIRRADPQKADSLETIRKEDPKKFLDVIRAEMGSALKAKVEPDQKAGPKAAEQSEWQQQLQKRYAYFMDWFAKEFPADHAELVKVQAADTEKYVQRVIDMMAIYEPILKAQKYNPPLADVMKQDIELQKKRDALLQQIRTATADEQPRLLKEMESLVASRFDIIVRKKELQYESLRNRLEKLSEQLDQQALELENLKKNKAQTVDAHIKELMSRSEKISL